MNEQKNLVRALPNEVQLAGWIEQAKGLERAVYQGREPRAGFEVG